MSSFGSWLKKGIYSQKDKWGNAGSQSACARACGVSSAAVHFWVTGYSKPSREMLAPLSEYLGVSVKELLERLGSA